ncbi:hypothetical protein [Zavarzinella formosa]|uniref:hypothetical protein n=1 Tax=Zavarzinella formosa TaxID=360055 RepID=UPI000374B66A|nr:hypothetical protein [Zavarzinella formosa]
MPATSEPDRNALEIERLRKEIDKLQLEIDAMRASSGVDRLIGRYLPLVTAMLAVAGFWFGVVQYYSQRTLSERERHDALLRETARPFWENQMNHYVLASKAASTIANSDDPNVVKSAETEFWILYWGPLSCFEDIPRGDPTEEKGEKSKVEQAMVVFGRHLQQAQRDRSALQTGALSLARAIRDEIRPHFIGPTTVEPARQR